MIHTKTVTGIILSAGNSTRFGKNRNKNFELINGKSVLSYSLNAFKNNDYIDNIIVVIKEENREIVQKIIMVKSKELLPLTGYIHGGCSPIGMKKQFKTIIDVSAKDFKTIIFSGGKIGYQVEVSLDDLRKIIDFELVDIQTIKNN